MGVSYTHDFDNEALTI